MLTYISTVLPSTTGSDDGIHVVMAGYNRTRYVEELLERTDALPPSFTVHLHLEYWTLNNGSKFLYNNQIASLLDDIRAHRIPVDFLELFEAARVPFYEGCMIVELLDYRPQRNKEPSLDKPERTRAVLHPNAETLWADICSLNQKHGGKWSDRDALDIEARLLLAISPPLCLDPDPHLTRIANQVMRVSTPTIPMSLKRKAAAMDPEEDETDKARRSKIVQFMSPRHNRTYTPTYRILDIQKLRQAKVEIPHPQINGQSVATSQQSSPTKPSTPSESYSHAHSPPESNDKKAIPKKGETPQPSFSTTAFTRSNGAHTPVPPIAATHQFITSLNPSPSPAKSPMQPQVYPSVQAATEAAKRTPTPAQQHYLQPSRPPSSQPHTSHPTPQPQPQPQSHPQSMYQPLIPNQPFATSPLASARSGSASPSKANTNSTNTIPTEPGPIPQHLSPQNVMAYSYQLQQNQLAQAIQQRLRSNGAGGGERSTPTLTHTPSQSQSQVQTPSPARGSPRVIDKALSGAGSARRSPLPPQAQPAPHSEMPQHQQQQHLAFAAQHNAHLRPAMHGGPSLHPQGMSPHMANGSINVNGIRRTGTQSPLPPATDGPQQPPLHHQPPQQLHHGYAPVYGYAPMNFAAHAQVQAQGRAGYFQMGMGSRPAMMGVGVGVGGQGMMGAMQGSGQPVVVGPGKGGVGVPGR